MSMYGSTDWEKNHRKEVFCHRFFKRMHFAICIIWEFGRGNTTSCFETSYGHSPHASMSNPQFIKLKTASIGVLPITLRSSHIIVCKNLGFLQSIAKYGHPCFTIISTSVKYQIIITVLNLLNLSRLQCIYNSHFVSVFYSIHICKKHAISNFKL